MLTANNAALGLTTRTMLRDLVAGGDLDEGSEELLLRALDKTRPRSHAGWVFALAEALGAERITAMLAGSFAELCCAAIDLVDDVQDGDAGTYLGPVPPAVQINVSEHMLVVSVLAACRLEERVGRPSPGLVAHAYRLFSAMASGQRGEVTREGWSVQRYVDVAKLTCGKQYEMYLRTAAYAAVIDPALLLALAEPLGVATQIACDTFSADPRLTQLCDADVSRIRGYWIEQARMALAAIPLPARCVLEEVARFPLGTKTG